MWTLIVREAYILNLLPENLYACIPRLADLEKVYIKQLLDEFEHDIMNYQNRGLITGTRGFDNS